MKCYKPKRSLRFLGRGSKTWVGDTAYTGIGGWRDMMVGGLGWRPPPRLSPAPSPHFQAYPAPGADAAQCQLLWAQLDLADKLHPISGLQAEL